MLPAEEGFHSPDNDAHHREAEDTILDPDTRGAHQAKLLKALVEPFQESILESAGEPENSQFPE